MLTNILKYSGAYLIGIGLILVSASFAPSTKLERLSLDLMARTLFQGKSVVGKGSLYYRFQGGLLVTKMDTPYEQLIVTSAVGEYKSYDFLSNQVMLMQGAEYSSRASFLYTFLSGKVNDMGLKEIGYKLVESNVEEGFLVNLWNAPVDRQVLAQTIKVVYENYLPIFMGFYKLNGDLIQKTYYTNYQPVAFTQVPMTITEIDFINESDSVITQRQYSNLKTNDAVSNEWLSYQIPNDAEVVKAPLTNPLSNQ